MGEEIMPFLTVPGAFYAADQSIHDQEFVLLKRGCEEKESEGALGEALLYAQKASILYGIPGLMLYFPLRYESLVQEQKEGELIDQALVQVLGLILFAQKWLKNQTSTEPDQGEVLEALEQWETRFLALTSSAELVLSESTYLMSHYAQEASIDSTHTSIKYP